MLQWNEAGWRSLKREWLCRQMDKGRLSQNKQSDVSFFPTHHHSPALRYIECSHLSQQHLRIRESTPTFAVLGLQSLCARRAARRTRKKFFSAICIFYPSSYPDRSAPAPDKHVFRIIFLVVAPARALCGQRFREARADVDA